MSRDAESRRRHAFRHRICAGCLDAAAHGGSLCRMCFGIVAGAENPDAAADRLVAGLCVDCGGADIVPGRARCRACAAGIIWKRRKIHG